MSGTSAGGSTAGGAPRSGDAAGASARGGDTGAAGNSADQCTSFLPGVDKSCAAAADCVLVNHTLNCCGSVLEMAINSSAAADFKTVEQGCDAQLPACGCASFGTSAEDGTLVSNPSTIVAACINHTCESHYGGSTFDCSGSVCTDQQYCIIWSGGTGGAQPKGTCSSFVENCNDCGCTGAGICACAVEDGHVVVHCQAT